MEREFGVVSLRDLFVGVCLTIFLPPVAADGQRHNLSDQVGTARARVFIVINTFVGKYSYLKGFVRITYVDRILERKIVGKLR